MKKRTLLLSIVFVFALVAIVNSAAIAQDQMIMDALIAVKDLTLACGICMVQQHLEFTINRGEIFIIMEDSGC